MAERVIAVHSITSASPGWTTQNGQPIACFALVTTTTAEHPGQFNEQVVIPLTVGDINTNLLGREIDPYADGAEFAPA